VYDILLLQLKTIDRFLSSFQLTSNLNFLLPMIELILRQIYIFNSFLLFNDDDNRSMVRKIIDDRLLLYKGNYTRLIESHIYMNTV
jgi:hypothetical protein